MNQVNRFRDRDRSQPLSLPLSLTSTNGTYVVCHCNWKSNSQRGFDVNGLGKSKYVEMRLTPPASA